MKKLTLLMTVALAFASGCTATETGVGSTPDGVEAISSELARERSPSNANAETLAQGNRAFAFDLYQQLKAEDGNLFYSPYSISIALSMLYAGAEGDTEAQMKSALHFDLEEPALHEAFNYVDLELESRGETAAGVEGEPFSLNVVNGVWQQTGAQIKKPYLDTLAVNYGAQIYSLDIGADPEGARMIINDWVSDQTNMLIPELFPQGTIDAMTYLVLTNAVYFNAAWANPFKAADTVSADFTKLDGTTVSVDMMNQVVDTSYGEGTNWQAVSFPYDASELAFVAVLPSEGQFEAVQDGLNEGLWTEISTALSAHQVTLAMPKFKTGSKFPLAETLKKLGMTDAFVPGGADLSDIQDPAGVLFVQSVIHEAVIEVDEEGTEAAAATGVTVGVTSLPPQATLSLNRPFLYFIVDKPTGHILFIGRILDPADA